VIGKKVELVDLTAARSRSSITPTVLVKAVRLWNSANDLEEFEEDAEKEGEPQDPDAGPSVDASTAEAGEVPERLLKAPKRKHVRTGGGDDFVTPVALNYIASTRMEVREPPPVLCTGADALLLTGEDNLKVGNWGPTLQCGFWSPDQVTHTH
jgi:hypothetical protein